ncbi:hypothetical protein [Burkholderia diffusa]|uniref:hypothetical protein n=1 Tax=Burkholderia diffusa TaxID=488732 RepID=UPI0018C8C8A4|nr:hypothetical protein [Burkholderia diffusa]
MIGSIAAHCSKAVHMALQPSLPIRSHKNRWGGNSFCHFYMAIFTKIMNQIMANAISNKNLGIVLYQSPIHQGKFARRHLS